MTDQIVTIETSEPTVAEELERSLIKVDVTDQKIAEMLALAATVAKPITSWEQYNEADRVRKQVKQVRLIGEKGIERVDRRYLDLRQASLAKKKELMAKIHEPELIIEVHTKAWEKEVERKKKEEEDLVMKMREERKNFLMALGYVFVPGPPEHRFELEGQGIAVRDIMEFDNETWTNTFSGLRMHAEEIIARKEEEKRLADEAAEALRQRAEDLERAEKALREQQEKLNAQVNEARKNELLALGCTLDHNNEPTVVLDGRVLWGLQFDVLWGFSTDEWASEVLAAKLAVEERNIAEKKAQAELARREAAKEEALRIQAEADARKRLEEEAAAKERAEHERIAKMNDVQKWEVFVAAVKGAAPEMSSHTGSHAIKRVVKYLDDMTPGLLQDLKTQ